MGSQWLDKFVDDIRKCTVCWPNHMPKCNNTGHDEKAGGKEKSMTEEDLKKEELSEEYKIVETYFDNEGKIKSQTWKKTEEKPKNTMKVPIKVEVYMNDADRLMEVAEKVEELRDGSPCVDTRYIIDLR